MKNDPRPAKLKGKRSAPNLRTKRSAINIPASGKARKAIKENYVPGVRSRASAPNLKQAAEELTSKPPSLPSAAPESQINESNDKQDGESQPKEVPRFMLFTETKIKPVEYRPPRQYTGPPIPKIMGIEPMFFRPKPVEIKKESRKERILKEIRKRYQVRKARVRGVVKNLRNIRALRTLHALKASVKAMRKDAQERLLEVRVVKDGCYDIGEAEWMAYSASQFIISRRSKSSGEPRCSLVSLGLRRDRCQLCLYVDIPEDCGQGRLTLRR
jgi:hypothetical protein